MARLGHHRAMPRWVDTHCHLDAHEFAADVASVRARAGTAGVGLCVIPAVDAGNFDAVRVLAHRFGDAYALGIHPMCTGAAREVDLELLDDALSANSSDPRLVAVGEIGLDYFIPGIDDEKQQRFYRAQLLLARKHALPVLLHVRRSADQLLKQLRRIEVPGGIGHAFNGSEQQAGEFIKLGFKLGFGGTVTFERALQVRRLATALPLAAIVMETDSPDIQPHWIYRTAAERATGVAQARNEPGELPRIGAELAGLRGIDAAELARVTTRNAVDAMPRLAGLLAEEAR